MRHYLFFAALALASCRDQLPALAASARVSLHRIHDFAPQPDSGSSFAEELEDADAIAVDDTTFALLDYPGSRVLLLGLQGQVLRAVGRHGGGPGEFLNPRFLVRLPLGFGVFDDLKLALVTFDQLGRPKQELPMAEVTGPVQGILTGIAALPDGWVFAVTEPPPLGPRQVLYIRTGGTTQTLATTPPAPGTPVRLPCGITLSPQTPVFWPTLRWAAAGDLVAYAVTADDRVVVWDAAHGDSTVLTGPTVAQPATMDAAAQLPLRVQASTGRAACSIDASEVARQRGLASRIPAIRQVLVTRGHHIWVELASRDSSHALRVYRPGGLVDTLKAEAAPLLLMSDTTFVGEQAPEADGAMPGLWGVHFEN